jgi:hypothetical protein
LLNLQPRETRRIREGRVEVREVKLGLLAKQMFSDYYSLTPEVNNPLALLESPL